jgi:hypothetical protein
MVQENICKHSRDNIDYNPSLTFMRIYLPMYLQPTIEEDLHQLATFPYIVLQGYTSPCQTGTYPTILSPTYKTYCDTKKPSTTLPLYSLAILAFSQSGPGRSRPKFPTAGGGKGWRGDRKHYKGEQASEGQEPGSLAAGFQTVGERQGQGAEWMQACTGREGRRRGRGKRSGTGCK